MSILFGVLALLGLVLLLKGFVRANPSVIARRARLAGGVAAVAAGGLLTFRGQAMFGFPLLTLGVLLLQQARLPSFGARTGRSPGSRSRVRAARLEMELDHETGAMTGRVLAGAFAGRGLDTLERGELLALARELAAADPEDSKLLEAYLDRRLPGWREDLDRDMGARDRGAAREGALTEEEAYQILGLEPGAGAEEIRRAHRSLMKKLHPDQGGSTYLAARVNAAKELLLSRHR